MIMKNNTTGSLAHDSNIVSRRMTQQTVADKKRKLKSGYRKHKKDWE